MSTLTVLCLATSACNSTPEADASSSTTASPSPRELFPHVRFDKEYRLVEFDAAVSCDCHRPTTPRVYLEVTACTPDSREYESLIVTRALPSHVHAALLLAGLVPGEPGAITSLGGAARLREPSGDPLTITFTWHDDAGTTREVEPLDWVIDLSTGAPLRAREARPNWVFSGSRIVNYNDADRYEADLTGTLIGLTTFGSESIAFSSVLSPDTAVQEPGWIADIARVPRVGTPVVVRITPRSPAHPPRGAAPGRRTP